MIDEDPRRNLPPKTLVIWRGKLFRTFRRVLDATGKPGMNRIRYVLEPGGVTPRGEPVFGVFRLRDLSTKALELELVGDLRSFDPSLGHRAL